MSSIIKAVYGTQSQQLRGSLVRLYDSGAKQKNITTFSPRQGRKSGAVGCTPVTDVLRRHSKLFYY